MERLYGNFFSSYRNLELPDDELKQVCTYVARKDGEYDAIFLFLRRQGKINVLNEVIRIDSARIRAFADHVFTRFRDVNVITFKAIETDIDRIVYPHQRFNYSEDIAMKLPPTADEYLARLGKNTRRNIKRYSDKLMRSFPSLRYEVYEREAVSESQVREIVGLNRERMASKNKVSALNEEETRRIVKRARSCGLVGIMSINDKICAGAISYCTGENYFLDVLAHDLAYNDYWVGILCCYMTIRECIARGGKEFHFLWGRYEYKFALGASLRHLDCVAVYRSRLQFLLNGDFALKTALNGYVRATKVWLHHSDSRISARILKLLDDLRNLRYALTGWLTGGKNPSF
ncbi:GNAT family N-acetyltransferase [Noviherbaspirillum massiliense]|uniref:GNAT family N-acetyltransferase n=1 Tax=Noviherbaspirillum massiliense TaxID=1465823 RepID=UPI001375AD2D|nr:GNAT family N-acetyltransferase [Noviherbaspirillum massiliense]